MKMKRERRLMESQDEEEKRVLRVGSSRKE